MNIVDTIVNSPRDSVDDPLQKIEMFVTYVGSNDTVPAAPLLNTPANNTMGVGVSKTVKWFTVSDGIIYHVEVSTDSTFATLFKSVDVGTNLYYVSPLVPNTTYYWRVRTNNGGHFSPYSSVWNFNTTGVGVETFTAASTKIVVSPNPSSGTFNFSNLDKESRIEIYDITGKLVYQTNQKNTSCTIDLSDKDKGIYFYRVANEKKEARSGKIILY
jgi:hypothetical protein